MRDWISGRPPESITRLEFQTCSIHVCRCTVWQISLQEKRASIIEKNDLLCNVEKRQAWLIHSEEYMVCTLWHGSMCTCKWLKFRWKMIIRNTVSYMSWQCSGLGGPCSTSPQWHLIGAGAFSGRSWSRRTSDKYSLGVYPLKIPGGFIICSSMGVYPYSLE